VSSQIQTNPKKKNKTQNHNKPESNNVIMNLKLATNVTRKSYQAFSSSCLKQGFATRSHTADPDIHSGQQKPGYTNTRVSPEVINF
jgi:hypothetical protein